MLFSALLGFADIGSSITEAARHCVTLPAVGSECFYNEYAY